MITKENLTEVVNNLDGRTKKRIENSEKEYVVLQLHVFNSGYYVTAICTDNYNRYKNVSNYGDAILYTDEVINLLQKNY